MEVSNISAPYNFVPLSEKILYPDWGERVSQDIPFSDGMDGELLLRIEAVTDIFIRNGSAMKKTSAAEADTEFFHSADGEYYIPATSLKGMIRNVMEIASYGKMQHITDKRYAIRDLNLTAYRDCLTEKDRKSKVKAGFLDISSADWKIYPCEYAMFERSQINDSFGNKNMSAADKYLEYISMAGTLYRKADVSWFDPKLQTTRKGVPHWEAKLNDHGKESGTLVFTGQPQDYKTAQKSQKRHEFFFYNEYEEDAFFVDDPETLEMDEFDNPIRPNQDDFRFIHCEQSNSKDFEEWEKGKLVSVRKKYFNGRIPIFYVEENGVFRFGLAYMFRFAGLVSTAEAVRNTNPEHYLFRKEAEQFKPDMADLIFGYSTRTKSLRGRVQFSASKAEDQPVPLPEKEIILGTPKPTFYPAYLKQPENLHDKNKYKSFLSKDAEIRGWKRYPALGTQDFVPPEGVNMATTKVKTIFSPLPAGTVFTGKLRYHNLRPIELGALIWALQLQSPDHYCHTIGMAKPYGYGRIKIFIDGMEQEKLKEYSGLFQKYVLEQIRDSEDLKTFQGLPGIKALLEMAAYDNCETSWDFNYMELKDFSAAKGNKKKKKDPLVLEEYSVRPIPRAPKVVEEKQASAEEEFLKRLVNMNLKNAMKELQAGDFHFTQEQIGQIKNKYKNELKNPYSPDTRKMTDLLNKSVK